MDKQEILRTLLLEVAEATEVQRIANEEFKTVMRDTPSQLPQPDGVQRILNVSADASHARNKLRIARARLEQFQQHGYVPIDLRQPGN